MKKKINRIQAKTIRLRVDKNNIKNLFVRLDNRRDIRNSQVAKLKSVLENGGHFETPIVAHKQKGVFRLLDGNHRIEAIEKYLENKPQNKVELIIFYYEDLSDQEEKKMYTSWNCGLKQNTNDFVKQYWDDIPITKLIETKNGFPWAVSYRWSSRAIEFKTLIGAYLTKDDKVFKGGFMGSAISFINTAKKLNRDDYTIIKAFLLEYMQIYGTPDKTNPHYKQAPFYSLMRIWLDNIKNLNYPKMRKVMIRLRGSAPIIDYSKQGGTRENSIQCRQMLLNLINSGRKKPILI